MTLRTLSVRAACLERETGIEPATLLLGEGFGASRITGAVLIVAGVIGLALAP